MHKKQLLSFFNIVLLALIIPFASFAQQPTRNMVTAIEPKQDTLFIPGPRNPNETYARWSFNLRAGIDRVPLNNGQIGSGSSAYDFCFGADIEYTFSPLAGLSLDFQHANYHIDNTDPNMLCSDGLTYRGYIDELTVIGNINLMNLLFKNRRNSWQNFNTYARVGAGAGYYHAYVDKKGNDFTLVVPYGLEMNYNFGKTFALSLIGESRWHSSPNMGTPHRQEMGTAIWQISIGCRIKLGANRCQQHMRNTQPLHYDRQTTYLILMDNVQSGK